MAIELKPEDVLDGKLVSLEARGTNSDAVGNLETALRRLNPEVNFGKRGFIRFTSSDNVTRLTATFSVAQPVPSWVRERLLDALEKSPLSIKLTSAT